MAKEREEALKEQMARLKAKLEKEKRDTRKKERMERTRRLTEKGATIEFLMGNDSIEVFEKKLMIIRTILRMHYPEIFGRDYLDDNIENLDNLKAQTKKAVDVFLQHLTTIESEKESGKLKLDRRDFYESEDEKALKEKITEASQNLKTKDTIEQQFKDTVDKHHYAKTAAKKNENNNQNIAENDLLKNEIKEEIERAKNDSKWGNSVEKTKGDE